MLATRIVKPHDPEIEPGMNKSFYASWKLVHIALLVLFALHMIVIRVVAFLDVRKCEQGSFRVTFNPVPKIKELKGTVHCFIISRLYFIRDFGTLFWEHITKNICKIDGCFG